MSIQEDALGNIRKEMAKGGLTLQVPSEMKVAPVKPELKGNVGDDDSMIISDDSEKEERDLSSLPAYYKLDWQLLKKERNIYIQNRTVGVYSIQMSDLGNPDVVKLIEKCHTFTTKFHAPKSNPNKKWDGFMEITFLKKGEALDAVEQLKSIRSSLKVVLYERNVMKANMVREWQEKNGCKNDQMDVPLLLVDEIPEGTTDDDMWDLFPDAMDIVMPSPTHSIHGYVCIYYATPEKRDAAIEQSVNKTLHGQPLKVIRYEASLVPANRDKGLKKKEPLPYPGFLTRCQLNKSKTNLKQLHLQLRTAEEAGNQEEIETLKPRIQELENKLDQRKKQVAPKHQVFLQRQQDEKEAAKEARRESEKNRQENLKKFERVLKEEQFRRKIEATRQATAAAALAKVESKKKQYQKRPLCPSGVPSLMSARIDRPNPVKDNAPRGQQQRSDHRNDKGRTGGREGRAEGRPGWEEGGARDCAGSRVERRAEGRAKSRAEGHVEETGFGYSAREQSPRTASIPVPHPEYGYAAGPKEDSANSTFGRYAELPPPPPPAPGPPAVAAPRVTDYGHGKGVRIMGQANPILNSSTETEAPYDDLPRSGMAAAYDNAGGLGPHPNPTGKVAESYSHLAGRRPVEPDEPDMSQHPPSRGHRRPQNQQQQRRHSQDEQEPEPSEESDVLVAAGKLLGNIEGIDNEALEGLLRQLSDELEPQQALELLQEAIHEARESGDESSDEGDYNEPLRGEPARRPFQQGGDNRKRARFEDDHYM